MESKIRKAYAALVRQPGQDWAGLADIHRKVGGSLPVFKEAVRDLAKREGVHLAGEANRKALTDADHAAAVRFGGEDNHILLIQG